MSKIPFPTDHPIDLPRYGSWPATRHQFDQTSVDAINASLAAQRPLLVRGEPGTGKSQLARAAAQHLGRLFVSEVVHARSESQDLLWHFDAVGRLGEAQALGAMCQQEDAIREKLDPLRYLAPGALWWVLHWDSALEQSQHTLFKHRQPLPPKGWKPEQGSVLLIDEIDKADADLPNGLLETLGNGGFSVPYLDTPVAIRDGMPPPLVVITTNEERELPAAFVRRCFVLHLRLPDQDPRYRKGSDEQKRERLVDWLVERGETHFGSRIHPDVRRQAARQLWEDRQEAGRQGVPPPGQAEYLDLLRALDGLAGGDTEEQKNQLESIQAFALKKFAGLY